MGNRTRDEQPDDDDDLLGDDLDGDPEDDAVDEFLPRSILDDEPHEDLDDFADPAFGETLDEFIVDIGAVRDIDGSELPDEAWPDDPPPGELPTLPWSTRAALPELGIDLAAVLDPTRDLSEWVLPSPGHRRLRTLVIVAGVRGEVELTVREGAEEQLRLGRDWLSGRAVVDSGGRADRSG